MQPPQLHINLLSEVNAGMLPISTVGAPTTQGAVVIGMQGMGVSAPNAAAVAAATIGFAILVHIPKGMTFNNGLLSMMLAAGISTNTLLAGNTINVEGAAPKVQLITAPAVTKFPITSPDN
jgi:hypothetical protein